MTMYYDKPPTEGFIGQYPSSSRWHSDQYVYPNNGPFYGSAKQAMRQCGRPEGRAWRAVVTYVEVDANGDPIRCPNCSGWTRYEGDGKHCDQCDGRGINIIEPQKKWWMP